MKTGTEFWDARRGVIRTRKGGWVIGKGITSHGYSMMDDLVGHVGFFEVLILNVTGRLPERRLAEWLEAIFICLSWPDPRIWCNHLGALGGSVRTSPVAAICAGTLAADSSLYGPGTLTATFRFITGAMQKRHEGWSAGQIIETQCKDTAAPPKIPGFARPIARGDERVVAMQRVADALGYGIGPHLELAYEIQDVLFEKYGEGINLAGYVAAFLSDQGFSYEECYRILSMCVNGGVHACYSEAADRAPESFLPLRCEDIEYQGKPQRGVPRYVVWRESQLSTNGIDNSQAIDTDV